MGLRFDPDNNDWSFSLAWPKYKVAAQVDALGFINRQFLEDWHYSDFCRMVNRAQWLGWKVFFFTNAQVASNEAVQVLGEVIRAEKAQSGRR